MLERPHSKLLKSLRCAFQITLGTTYATLAEKYAIAIAQRLFFDSQKSTRVVANGGDTTLRKIKDLKSLSVGARAGDFGEVNDFIFDDKNWTMRYLVADTSRWLTGRKVLISPIVVDQAGWEGKRSPVSLTQEQVKSSPDISIDAMARKTIGGVDR